MFTTTYAKIAVNVAMLTYLFAFAITPVLAADEVGNLITNQLNPIATVYGGQGGDPNSLSKTIAEIIKVVLGFLGVMYALYNAYGFVAEPASKISYIAHFGGLFAGLAYGFRRQGIKKSLTTIAIIIFLMVVLPLAWMMLVR